MAGAYTVAFRGSKFPSTDLGIYYWDTTPVGPIRAFAEGDIVTSIETTSASSPFSGSITAIDAGAPPAISVNGHLAQLVTLSNPSQGFPPQGSPGQGVVRHVISTGSEWVACNSEQPVNGETYLLKAISRPLSIESIGTVGFRCTTTAGSGIFREATTGIDKVAATNDPADGTIPAGSFNVIGGNNVNTREQQWNSSNTPAFFSTTTASGTNAVGTTGIWTDTVSGVFAVALSNAEPWGSVGNKWSVLEAPSINDSGDIAFKACEATSACNVEGVWARVGGTGLLISRTGMNAPSPTGSSTGETFVDFGMPVIDSGGRVAFWATTNATGNPQGIWIADGTGPLGVRRIARKDDAVRGTNASFLTFGKDLAIADTGQVAFTATLTDTVVQTTGLFVESEYHTLIKIARTTEQFDLPNGTSPAITGITFYPGASSQGVGGLHGTPSPSQETVAVAFQLGFPNGHSAVVLTVVGP